MYSIHSNYSAAEKINDKVEKSIQSSSLKNSIPTQPPPKSNELGESFEIKETSKLRCLTNFVF